MNRLDIVRAWKDEEYRMSLTEAERAALPPNPAGVVELNDSDLKGQAGRKPPKTMGCPITYPCPRSLVVRICPHTLQPQYCPGRYTFGCHIAMLR